MKGKKQTLFIFLLLPLFVFLAFPEEGQSFNVLEFLGKSVNFVVLFGALVYFLYKPLQSYLEKRSLEVKEAMKDAEESRKESEKRFDEARARLAGLEEEIEKIKKEAEVAGLREKEKISRLAQEEAERIKHLAQQEIELELKAGTQELKEYTAALATNLAQERIKKKLTEEDHSLLIDKSIKKFVKLYEKSNSHQKVHSRTG